MKPLEDSDNSQDTKTNLNHKNDSLGWCPELGKLVQNVENMPPLWRQQRKTPIPKETTFFQSSVQDFQNL